MQDESPPLSQNMSHGHDAQSETVRHYNGGPRSDSFRREEWRTRVTLNRTGSSFARAAPNPNDEEAVPTIVLEGRGPGRRAGHTATAVNRRIYIFGGSCGSDYLVRAYTMMKFVTIFHDFVALTIYRRHVSFQQKNDFFMLDTDPTPRTVVTQPASLQLFERRIRHFYNNEEFSDVTFLVEGRRVYGHKMILSIVSDCFHAMFTTGFRESEVGAEIEIPGCSYDAFLDMMNYIYTGKTPKLQAGQDGEIEVQRVVDLLEIADQFMLDHLREICEQVLQPTVNAETVEYWLQVAQKTNASQLAAICEHFLRNKESG
jgi:leucine-zipper-like transcriptional regulator 1